MTGYIKSTQIKVKVDQAKIISVSLQEKINALEDSWNGVYLYSYLEPIDQVTYYHFSKWTATEKMIDEAFFRMVEDGEWILD